VEKVVKFETPVKFKASKKPSSADCTPEGPHIDSVLKMVSEKDKAVLVDDDTQGVKFNEKRLREHRRRAAGKGFKVVNKSEVTES
jgi:hypothetical protein